VQYCSSSEDKDNMEEYEGTQMELSHDFLFSTTKEWKKPRYGNSRKLID
jgi:hypothetical protein